MKTNKILMSCVVVLITIIQSCSKMNDLSDKFLDEGETIYAAKIDAYGALSGKNNVQMYVLINSQRVELVRIYWNNYTDSIDMFIGGKTGVFDQLIDNLPEGGYLFQIVSFDKFGNKSLPVEASGESLGERFIGNLLSRSIKTIQGNSLNQKLVMWNSMDTTSGAKYTEILYKGTSYKTPVKENQTNLPGYQSGEAFKYRTAYIPAMSVDTFYTDYQDYTFEGYFPLIKSAWKVTSFSSQHDDGNNAAKNVIDGTDATRWHTRAGDGMNHYPHWIIIDLGGNVEIVQFGVWGTTFEQTAGNIDDRLPTKIQFEVSTDNVTWTDLGEYACDNHKLGQQPYPVAPATARYFRFTGVVGHSGDGGNMVTGELDVYIK